MLVRSAGMMVLISSRVITASVEHFIGQSAHQVLSCVHTHVGVAGVPINRPPNFVADFELMTFSHGVRYVAAAPYLRNLHVAVCSREDARVPVLPATQRVEQRSIENDVVSIHGRNLCVKLTCVGSVNVLEVQFDCHGLGTVRVLMRLTVKGCCSNSGFDVLARQLFLQFTETDHPAVDLIPQSELNGLQAAKEAQFRCRLEKRM